MNIGNKIGRKTHIVECRATSGLLERGDLAFPGTLSESQHLDIIVIAMSASSRHITKPVCQITYALRNAGLNVSVLVLSSGGGMPEELSPRNTLGSSVMSISRQESLQIARYKLAIIHVGNVPSHFIPKIKKILKNVEIPAIVVSQASIDFDDLALNGIRTPHTDGESVETKGIVIDLVDGVVRGQRCPPSKINEIIIKVKSALRLSPSYCRKAL